jgi:hypothetical protein
MTTPTRPAARPSASARIIHAALILGVLLFVATSWYIVRSRPRPPAPDDLRAFYVALCLVTASGLLGAMLVARRVSQRVTGQPLDQWWLANMSRALTIWALAEAPALFGGVIYLLSGDARALLATLLAVATMWRFAPSRLARAD